MTDLPPDPDWDAETLPPDPDWDAETLPPDPDWDDLPPPPRSEAGEASGAGAAHRLASRVARTWHDVIGSSRADDAGRSRSSLRSRLSLASIRSGLANAARHPRWIGGAVFVGVLLVLGFLVAGFEVLPVALLALLASLAWRREPGRPLALTASLLLALTAIGTVFVVDPSPANWTMNFPSDRTLAAESGRLAGLLFALASVLMAYTEQSRRPAPSRPLFDRSRLPSSWLTEGVGVPALVVAAAVVGGIVLVAFGVRLALAPPALSAAFDTVVANLRYGTSYGAGVAAAATTPVSAPPLAPLVVAYLPVSPHLLSVAFGMTSLLVGVRLAQRLGGLWAGGVALALGAMLPAMWDVPLPVILAGLALVGGVMMAEPARIDTGRAVWAGILLGGAVLARPETAVAVGLVVAWSWTRGTIRRHLVAMAALAVAVTAPWWVWLHTQFGGIVPGEGLRPFLSDAMAAGRHAPMLTAVGSLAVLGAGMALAWGRPLWREWWILWAVPVVAVALDGFEVQARDPLYWSAPLAVVLLAVALVERLRPAGSDQAGRRHGALTGPLPFGFGRGSEPDDRGALADAPDDEPDDEPDGDDLARGAAAGMGLDHSGETPASRE